MSRIEAVGHAFPPHHHSQEQLLHAFREAWEREHYNPERLERLHRNVLVGGRHLALPLEAYLELDGFGDANDAWLEVAPRVGAEAVRTALAAADRDPGEVDALVTVTVTGIATPSLDARLVEPLGLRPDVRRLPVFGLGCVAGAAGIARASELRRGLRPTEASEERGGVVVLLSVKLCSLTLQRDDLSIPNLIASGLFGDGAAAVVLGDRNGPEVVATASVFYPGTERVMGWDVTERGFGIVLSAEVPDMVRRHLRRDVDRFLDERGLERSDVARWIAHPGGPRVLEAMQEALELPDEALEPTWRSLREVGNLSSTSVLLVLEEALADPPPAGSLGLVLAMGPGFCSELVLIRW